jgi:hypothetical protein
MAYGSDNLANLNVPLEITNTNQSLTLGDVLTIGATPTYPPAGLESPALDKFPDAQALLGPAPADVPPASGPAPTGKIGNLCLRAIGIDAAAAAALFRAACGGGQYVNNNQQGK